MISPLSLASRTGRRVFHAGLRPVSFFWAPYSRLILVGDHAAWSISWDIRELGALARELGIRVAPGWWVKGSTKQSVFYGSRYELLHGEFPDRGHRVGMAYFHGKPGTAEGEFDHEYRVICDRHEQIHRIQVSHSDMRAVILETGIDPAKVFQIPIGINLSFFSGQTPESKREIRCKLGIPESAVVIGSFQKDGVGWGEGLEPKLIKGPDVFVRVMGMLQDRIPGLFVLLSGPARGFVKAGLEQLHIPNRSVLLESYPEVAALYHALDAYVVSSRQEGGPKAVLEAMASGVPLITTRVGQAMDLVTHGVNAWMVDVEDVEGLAYWTYHAVSNRVPEVLEQAAFTAQAHTYESQLPLWRDFMTGFVEFDSDHSP